MGSAFERSSKLPNEIISAEKCRSDYLKWKLLLVAVLGAAGFGLGEKGEPVPLLLALIPFVCIYVDLLCTNLKIRIILIGTFYATKRDDPYEKFVEEYRNVGRNVFSLDDCALYWSTLVVCAFLILIGSFSQPVHRVVPPESVGAAGAGFTQLVFGILISPASATKASNPSSWQSPGSENVILILTGSVGIVLSLFTYWISQKRIDKLSPPKITPGTSKQNTHL